MQHDAWNWSRVQSNPPPECLWQLWWSVSTLTEPFRPDGSIFCWCREKCSKNYQLERRGKRYKDLFLVEYILESILPHYTSEHLAALATSLGAPQITVVQFGKAASLGTLLVHLEIMATTFRSTIVNLDVLSLNSHLSIYIATHLQKVYLDKLQRVLVSNSRCAWKRQSSKLNHSLQRLDGASLKILFDAVMECNWRYTSRP
jgi:hypothetical protein